MLDFLLYIFKAGIGLYILGGLVFFLVSLIGWKFIEIIESTEDPHLREFKMKRAKISIIKLITYLVVICFLTILLLITIFIFT